MKLEPWKVVKATNGVIFIERKTTRFAFMFDDTEAKALATLLNRKDREIAKLIAQIDDMRRGQ